MSSMHYYVLWQNCYNIYKLKTSFVQGHCSVLLFAFDLERVLTSEDRGGVGKDSGEGGLESGTN